MVNILDVSMKQMEKEIAAIEDGISKSIETLCEDNDIDADIVANNYRMESQNMNVLYAMNRNISDVAVVYHNKVVVVAIVYDYALVDTLYVSETMSYPTNMDLFEKFIVISDVCGYALREQLNGWAFIDVEKTKKENYSIFYIF